MTITYALNEIEKAAASFAGYLEESGMKVVIFNAPMGAGKTTFITQVCKVLGVTSVLSSPTYAIINEYTTAANGPVYHMDWYRLEDEHEAIDAGVEDALYSGNYCFVEWPVKAEGLLPAHYINVHIHIVSETERRIEFNLS